MIVAYNSRGCIERCLNAVTSQSVITDYEILLVDNGEDDTEGFVRSNFPQVKLVPSEGNIGFARGNNLLARRAEGSFLLLLNPDMYLKPGSIDALMKGARRHPHASAWGGVTVTADGEPDTGNAIPMPSILEFATAAAGRSRAGTRLSKVGRKDEQTALLSGGFVMFSRKAWDQAGGFDESFFLYCEEVDLFYRLAQSGHEFWQIADARAHHAIAHGNSLSPMRSLYRAAGTMQFVRKHWSSPRTLAAIVLIWSAAAARFGVGQMFGWSSDRLAKLAAGYRPVAINPSLWIYGYDCERGLMTRLSGMNP